MLHLVLIVSQALLFTAFAIAVVRLVRGPSLPDRVIALDLISVILGGLILVFAIQTGMDVLVDAVVILTLIAFFGTVAFGRYLERQITE